MKFIIIAIKVIGIIFLLSITTIAALIIYLSTDKADTFYLHNAQFNAHDYPKNPEKEYTEKTVKSYSRDTIGVYAHRLAKGSGTIYAYRWYSGGDVMTIDDEQFRKLTIWLASPPTSYPAELDFSDSNNLQGIYTTGSSAHTQTACTGYINTGKLLLDKSKSDGSVSVQVTGKTTPIDYPDAGEHCSQVNIDFNFLASELKFTDLTPWLGTAGKHPYDETYRP